MVGLKQKVVLGKQKPLPVVRLRTLDGFKEKKCIAQEVWKTMYGRRFVLFSDVSQVFSEFQDFKEVW